MARAAGAWYARSGARASVEDLERRIYLAADLVFTSAVVHTPSYRPGEQIEISWTVKNQGDELAGQFWWDGVYYSTDDQLDLDSGGNPTNGDVFIHSTYRPGSGLEPNASYTQPNRQTNLPNEASVGPAYLLFKVDNYGQQPEGNEENNILVKPITISPPNVDLRATNPVGVPAQAKLLQPYQFTFSMVNDGSSATYAWFSTAGIYLSTDGVWDENDIEAGVAQPQDNTIPAGGSTIVDAYMTLPHDVAAGSYQLLLVADNLDYQPEDNEANNTLAVPIELAVPDVNLRAISGTLLAGGGTHLTPGQSNALQYTVLNEGSEPARGLPWNDVLYFSTDSVFSPATDTRLGSRQASASTLNGGATYSANFGFTTPANLPSSGFLLVVPDFATVNSQGPYGRQPETSEADNAFALAVTVAAYDLDLTITGVTAPATGRPGDVITVSWTGDNLGSITPFGSSAHRDRVSIRQTSGGLISLGDFWVTPDPATGTWSSGDVQVTLPSHLNPALSWELVVTADGVGALLETNEQNNALAEPITIQPRDVDLEIASVTAPAFAQPGQPLTIPYRVRNNGTEATTAAQWRDVVILSVDDQIDATDPIIADRFVTGPLAGGAFYDQQFTPTLSSNLALGQYHLIFRTDYLGGANTQFETNENNNQHIVPLTVARSNLTVVSASAGGTTSGSGVVGLGEQFTVTWTVKNTGTAPTWQSRVDRVWLSRDGTVSADDIQLSSEFPPSSVAPDATYTLSATRGFLVGTDYRDYQIIVEAPPESTESNTIDNHLAVPLQVTGGNLVAENVVVTPPAPSPGTTMNVSFTIRNSGETAITRPGSGWLDMLALSVDPIRDPFDLFLTNVFTTEPAALAPGEAYTASASVLYPTSASGYNYLLVVPDSDNRVQEAGNLVGTGAYSLAPSAPDLVVSAATIPPAGTVGEQVGISWTVSNTGNAAAVADWWDSVYLSADGELSSDDRWITALSAAQFTPLDPSGGLLSSYTQNTSISLPQVAPGSYQLLFVADRFVYGAHSNNNLQGESNENNNLRAVPIQLSAPDLTITAVTAPSSGVSSGLIDLGWTGKNLSTDVAALADWYDSVYLSIDDQLDGSDLFVAVNSAGAFSPLAPEATYSVSRTGVRLPSVAGGNYHLLFAIDNHGLDLNQGNRQAETSENNNVFAHPISITAPDLTIDTATAPTTAVLSGSVPINWTVRNLGPGVAPAIWWDAIYLSNDNTLGGGDVFLKSVQRPGTDPVPVGTYDASTNVTIPATLGVGSKYLILVTDGEQFVGAPHRQGEQNESNNTFMLPIELVTTDLTIENATVSAAAGAIGEPVTLGWKVRNAGTTHAPAQWLDRVYVSSDQTFSPQTDVLVASYSAAPHSPLAAGGFYDVSIPANLADFPPGARYLLFVADATNAQAEVNEGNNVQPVAFTMTAADLVVQNIQVQPAALTSGTTVTLTWDDVNQGNGPALGNFVDRVRVINTTTGVVLREANVAHDTGTLGPITPGAAHPRSYNFTLPHGNLAVGDLRFEVTVDAPVSGNPKGGVPEYTPAGAGAEENNTDSITRPSTLGNYPDLVVGSLELNGVGDALGSGRPATIRWILTNNGTAPTSGSWRDKVEIFNLDTKTTIYSESILTAGIIAPGGGTLQREHSITLPHGLAGAGQLLLTVRADATNIVFEANGTNSAENNNSASGQFTSALAAYPDLQVTSVVAPPDALSGGGVTVTWTVFNDGNADATGTWTDFVYLSPDAVPGDLNDRLYGNFAFTGTIPRQTSITRSQIIQLPPTLEGTFYAIVKTDAHNTLLDFPADNNTGVSAAPMVVTLRDFPNLVVPQVTAPAAAFSGTKTIVSWQVRNIGEAATAGTWQDSIYLSTNTSYESSDTLLGRTQNFAALLPQDVYTNQMEVTLPRAIDGTWYVILRTDSNNNVLEPNNEGDNRGVSDPVAVTLKPPSDLQVVSHLLPSALFSGVYHNFAWTVRNANYGGPTEASAWNDEVYLSSDDRLDAQDTRLGNAVHYGALEPDASYDASLTARLPVGVSGSKFILFRTDSANAVFEGAFDGNNVRSVLVNIGLTPPPDLEVSQLSADPAMAGRTFNVSYAVSNVGLTEVLEPTFRDYFILSPDDVLDLNDQGRPINGDILLKDVLRPGALPPDGVSARLEEVELDRTLAAGNYRLFVVADAGRIVFELDEGNNIGSMPLAIGHDRPDLSVHTLSTAGQVIAGTGLPIRLRLSNEGIGGTYGEDVTVSFRLGTQQDPSQGQQLLLTKSDLRYPAVGAGQLGEMVEHNIGIPGEVEPGVYWLFAEIDRLNKQPESNEGNNLSDPVRLVVQHRRPDLDVTDVVVPSSLRADQVMAVRWTVMNRGEGGTPSMIQDAIFLSRDDVLDDSDIKLQPSPIIREALAPGASGEMSEAFFLPITASGAYHIIAATDDRDAILEVTEANNRRAVPVTILPYEAPDLVVTGVNAPSEAYGGRPMSLTWTVQNQGGIAEQLPGRFAPSWYDKVFLSADAIFDPETDLMIGTAQRSGELAAGASYTLAGSFLLPRELNGTFHVFVLADTYNALYEGAGEANNLGQALNPTLVTLTPPADLVVQPFTVPSNGVSGKPVTVTYVVNNEGANPAQGSWYDSLYLSLDDQFDAEDAFLGRVQHFGPLAAGASYEKTVGAMLPGVVPGEYHVIVRSDILSYVPEGDSGGELNNIRASVTRITADAEELVLNGTASAGQIQQGQAVYYKVVVAPEHAGKTLRFSLDVDTETEAADELYVAYGRMPSRADFDARHEQATATDVFSLIPKARDGTYYVMAYGEGLPLHVSGAPIPVDYELSAEVVPFSVTAVHALTIGNTGPATLRLRGAYFDRATEFELVSPDGAVVTGTQSHVRNATDAYVTFDLTSRPAGAYDVRARRIVDGQPETATLEDGLEVLSGFGPHYLATMVAPNAARSRFPITINWANDGGADAPAPLILVVNDEQLPMSLSPAGLNAEYKTQLLFMGVGSGASAGVLRPAEVHATPIFAKNGQSRTLQAVYSVYVVKADDPRLLGESSLRELIPPSAGNASDFEALWPHVRAAVGPTWGSLSGTLARLAGQLPGSMGDRRLPSALMGLLVKQVRASLGASITGSAFAADTSVVLVDREVTARNLDTGEYFVTRSLADGTFVFDTVTPGTYSLSFAGAVVADAPEISVQPDTPFVGADLTLAPAATVAGAVRTGGNSAIGGAAVTIRNGDYSQTVLADELGRYMLEGVPSGTYTLVVEANGYARGRLDELEVLTAQAGQNFTLTGESQIGGTVGSVPPGDPLANYTITAVLRGAGTSAEPDAYTLELSGEGGAFTLAGLPAGTHDLAIARNGFATEKRVVTVGQGAGASAGDVVLSEGAAVRGQVVADTSVVLGGLVVGAFDLDGTLIGTAPVRPDGSYDLRNLAAGTYTLKVTNAPRGFPRSQTITLAGGELAEGVNLQVMPGASISGVVENSLGELQASLGISIRSIESGKLWTAVTGEDGTYRVDGLAEGEYVVGVTGSGVSTTVDADSDTGDAYTANFIVTATAHIGGLVLTAAGNPIGGARVTLLKDGAAVATTVATADGSYSFSIWQAGTYDLQAESQVGSFAEALDVDVEAGAEVVRSFRAGTGTAAVTIAGSPVGISVALYRVNADGALRIAGQRTLDSSSGNVAGFGELVAGTYEVNVTGPNNTGGNARFDIGVGGNAAVEVTPATQGQLMGTISGPAGPLVGAQVILLDATTKMAVGMAVTETGGTYAIEQLPDGTYDVVVAAAGFVTQVGTATVIGGAGTMSLNLAEGGPTLEGRVVDASGNPVSGAAVTLLDAAGRPLGFGEAAADGTFSMTGAAGATRLVAGGPGTTPTELVLDPALTTGTVNAGDVSVTAIATGRGYRAGSGSGLRLGGGDANGLLPGFLSNIIDALSNDPEQNGEVELSELLPLPEDCTDCDPLYHHAKNLIQLQDDWFDAWFTAHDMADSSAANAMLLFVTEVAIAAGAIAGLIIAADALAAAVVGAGSALGSAAIGYEIVYGLVQMGSNIKAIYDLYEQAMAASSLPSAIEAFNNAGNLVSNTLGLATGIPDAVSKFMSLAAKEFLAGGGGPARLNGGLSGFANILGFVAGFKSFAEALLLTQTRDALSDLERGLRMAEKAEENYEAGKARAWVAALLYNDCVNDCEREHDDEGDQPGGSPDRPDAPPDDEDTVSFPRSGDPNDIVGPRGFGEQNWTAVAASRTLPYTIRFENMPTATAPAQLITITQQLDSDLDLRSYRVDDFAFGPISVELPADRGFHTQRLDLRDQMGIYVDFTATIDLSSSTITFTLAAIDPATGLRPEDPTVGLLPPEDGTGRGQGFVSYTIRPKAGAPTGTVIDARAAIVFDDNEVIETPAIFNTLDIAAPASAVEALAATNGAAFAVRWDGSDSEMAAQGSGLVAYDVFVSVDGGPFERWLEKTELTTATYLGQDGHSYAFYSVGYDQAGNAEAAPTTADALTQVVGNNTQPVVTLGDNGQADEGSPFARTGSFFDPDAGDTWSAQVDYGEGGGWETLALNGDATFDLSHAFADDGDYTVKVRVTDGLGAFGESAITVSVDNVAPSVAGIPDATITAGETFIANATFLDPGADEWTGTVDYGEGNGAEPLTINPDRTFTLSHQYLVAGTFTVLVTVTDDEGAVGTQSLTVRVEPSTGANVTDVIIDNGTAQRSMVRSLTVVFDQSYVPGAGTFLIRQRLVPSDPGAGHNLISGYTWSNPSSDGRTWVLAFPSGAGFTGGSLADGVYDLSIDSGSGNSFEITFHRLFGDGNGDKAVDLADFGLFRTAFGRSSGDPLFNDAFDSDANGTIDLADFGNFRGNFGKSLPY